MNLESMIPIVMEKKTMHYDKESNRTKLMRMFNLILQNNYQIL